MKNNFEKKDKKLNNHKLQKKSTRREFVKNSIIGFSLGSALYILKHLLKNKKDEKFILDLHSEIENLEKEIEFYLQECNNYHKLVTEKLNEIEANFDNVGKQKKYIEDLEEYLEILTQIDTKLLQLLGDIEIIINKIDNLDISHQKIYDLKGKLLNIEIKIDTIQRINSEIIEKISELRNYLQEKFEKNIYI